MASGHATASRLLLVGDMDQVARGLEVERRRAELGMSRSALAARAHVDRATLKRIIEGQDGVRSTSLIAVEHVLDDLEEAVGAERAAVRVEKRVMRVEVRGIPGVDAIVVEAPVENPGELEEMVDRIMRRYRDNADGG